jgi:hypothetical protein
LSSELELPLVRVAASEWRGHFELDERRCEQFAYRIGLCAHVEAEWSLRLRHRELDCDLLVDSDRLMIAKCWLIGTCSVRRPGQRFTPRDDRTAGHASPQLVLLPGGGTKRCSSRGRDQLKARW